MRVDIEHVQYLLEERGKIDALNLEDIEFYFEGKKVDIPDEVTEEFMFLGLSNMDFIQTEYYLKELEGGNEMSFTDKLDRDDHWFHDTDMEDR